MTWLLIAVVAWVLVAVLSALALGHAIRVAEQRRRAIDAASPAGVTGLPAVGRGGEPFVPGPRVPDESEWRLPRGHRRPGAA